MFMLKIIFLIPLFCVAFVGFLGSGLFVYVYGLVYYETLTILTVMVVGISALMVILLYLLYTPMERVEKKVKEPEPERRLYR